MADSQNRMQDGNGKSPSKDEQKTADGVPPANPLVQAQNRPAASVAARPDEMALAEELKGYKALKTTSLSQEDASEWVRPSLTLS